MTRVFFWTAIWLGVWMAMPLPARGELLLTNESPASGVEELVKQASDGDPRAQLELGRNYLQGKGVEKNYDQAFKWLYEAADHRPPPARTPPATLKRGALLKKLRTLDGDEYKNVTIEHVEPDGLSISYDPGKGGLGMARVKFRELPEDIQKAGGFDPEVEAAFTIRQQALQEISDAAEARKIAARTEKKTETISTLTNIVVTYHTTHSYLTNEAGNSIYVCADMACDVWNMVVSRGIPAKILIGDIKQDITSITDCNHAWVLAEIGENEWLALETTGGFLVRRDQNKRYFFGCKFATAKDYRDFQNLEREFNDARTKYRAAFETYNGAAREYNAADLRSRAALKTKTGEDASLLKSRTQDLEQLKNAIEAFHLEPAL